MSIQFTPNSPPPKVNLENTETGKPKSQQFGQGASEIGYAAGGGLLSLPTDGKAKYRIGGAEEQPATFGQQAWCSIFGEGNHVVYTTVDGATVPAAKSGVNENK